MAEHSRQYGRVYHRAAKPRKGVARTFGEAADYSDHQGCEALYTNKPLDLLKCLRPGQWVKNLLLLAAPFFAYFKACSDYADCVNKAPWASLGLLGLGIVAFILLSSATYIFNDLVDAKSDAKHPLKKTRPIAARKVSLVAALSLLAVTLAGGLGLAWGLGGTADVWLLDGGCWCEESTYEAITTAHSFFWCAIAYLGLQLLYTLVVHKVKDFGEALVALGFLVRALAGGCLAGVPCEPHFLLCVFVGALFVVLCKRRSEHFIRNAPQPTAADARVLDIEISVTAASLIMVYLFCLRMHDLGCYDIYTLPWVVLGIFRYLRLTYADQHRAATPEVAFFRDPAMMICLLGWLATYLFVYLKEIGFFLRAASHGC